jgi:hypothetical protein
MASKFQQQALQRKLVYTGLILVLFTASIFWRNQAVKAQADKLGIRENDLGEVELSGSLIRLSLTGSRGVVTSFLWYQANEKFKKNQWNELELVVRSLAKLQPHYVTPWMYQSWNLAFNVAVQLDRVRDKYFYVSRGIQLLAEGERQNHDNPEMRYHVGEYFQRKICQSDETNVMRSLFNLSCIPPNERDPERFYVYGKDADGKQTKEINWIEFEKFCKDHPQLVRRLRLGLHKETKMEQERQFICDKAEDVILFLAENREVPSLFEDVEATRPGVPWTETQAKLKDSPLERFPTLPPPPRTRERPILAPQVPFNDYPNELTYESRLGDDVDGFAVSRAWSGYAQEPLPPPGDLPGSSQNVRDRAVQSTPRDLMRVKTPRMTTLFFRNFPARAQHYVASRLEEEGWYDDSGWVIPGWFEPEEGRLRDGKALDGKFSDGSEPRIGQGKGKYAVLAWSDAFDMWSKHGDRNHLLFNPPTEEDKMREKANRYYRKSGLPEGFQPQLPRDVELSPEEREAFEAARYLWEYNFYRSQSNFPHFYVTSKVEKEERTVKARKRFHEAEDLRLAGSPDRALAAFEQPDAVAAWRKILLDNQDFRKDSAIQEQTGEYQYRYLNLFNDLVGRPYRKALAERLALASIMGQFGQAAVGINFAPTWMPMAQTSAVQSTFYSLAAPGPFAVLDDKGEPLLDPSQYRAVLDRRGVLPKAPPEGGPSGGPAVQPQVQPAMPPVPARP